MHEMDKGPLDDDELKELAEALKSLSRFDIDGLLGVLHALAVSPGIVPLEVWLPLVIPAVDPGELGGMGAVRKLAAMILRLQSEVEKALAENLDLIPDAEDVEECTSFAEGYASAAALDASWVDHLERWVYAAPFAYLAGMSELVSKATREKFERLGNEKQRKELFCAQLGQMVVSARDAFKAIRRPGAAAVKKRKVGRNEACPCGSGKKYKRCCIGSERAG